MSVLSEIQLIGLIGVMSLSQPDSPVDVLPSNPNLQSQCVDNIVSCVYRTKVANLYRLVTVMWSKNHVNHSLHIFVENPSDEDPYTCKIDINTWQFWGKKGLKSFKVDEQRIDVFWDFRSAKFSTTNPEPCSDYYVVLVCNKEVVLLLGDLKKEAYQRTKARSSIESNSALVHKKENVSGKKCFTTKTMLGKGEKEHHIVIETSLSGYCEPEMWIGIDGIMLIRICNLHWRFRGNEMILVDNVPVQIYWDVHDWLYVDAESGPGMFIFKQGAKECDPDNHLYDGIFCCEGCIEFCHFLYVWNEG